MNEQEQADKKMIFNYLKEFADPLPYKMRDRDLSIHYYKDYIEAKYRGLNTHHQTYDVNASIIVYCDKVLINIYEKHAYYDKNTGTKISKKRYQTGGFELLNDIINMQNVTTMVETHRKGNKAGKKEVNILANEKEYTFTDGNDFLHNYHGLQEYYNQNKEHVKRI
ncbi:MAG: hypothetical protein IJI43_04160 [Bacilli bacterium]|nr:hypothetical protein [Bacilli bacterium]